MNDTVPLAALGIISTLVVFLIWLLKYLFTDYREVMNKLILSVETNTLATKAADAYLQQRNGRDIEFHKEIMVKLQDIPAQAGIQADVVASELKKQTDIVSEKLEDNTAKVEANTKGITEELKRMSDLTEKRIEQAKKDSKHQTIVEQTVETQIIK